MLSNFFVGSNREINVIIKNYIILNIMQYTFILRETEVVTCITLVLLKTPNGIKHYLKIEKIVFNAIINHNNETIVNFEPKYNCQTHHLKGTDSDYDLNKPNTSQRGNNQTERTSTQEMILTY